MTQKRTLTLALLSTVVAVCLMAAMLFTGIFTIGTSAATTTYNLNNKFGVYADSWSNSIEAVGEEVILHSKVIGSGEDAVFQRGNGGWVFNNNDGIGGWELNGLELQFYLTAGSILNDVGGEWMRLYIVNNIGWYGPDATNVGLSLWFRNYNKENNTTSILVRYMLAGNDVYADYDIFHNVPLYLDYDYFTDSKEEGVKPESGTLNTWKFSIVDTELIMNINGMEIKVPMGADSKAGMDILGAFQKAQMSDSAGFVIWRSDDGATTDTKDNGLAMRIVSAKNVREGYVSGAATGYTDLTGGDLEYTYNGLGYAKFRGTGDEYSFAYTADAYLDKMNADFLVNGYTLAQGDTFTVRMQGTETAYDMIFTKTAETDKAALTIKNGDQTVLTDKTVDFVWNGIALADNDGIGHSRIYNTLSIQSVAGDYTLFVNGTEITEAAESLANLSENNSPAFQLQFAVAGSNASEVTIRSIETEGQEVLESVKGFTVSDDVVILKVDETTAKFYVVTDTAYTVEKEGTLPANSFQTTFSVAKPGTHDKAFRMILDNEGKQVIVEFTYKTASTADVKMYIKDTEETLIGEGTNVDFVWSETETNQVGVVVVNGRLRLLVNKFSVINKEDATEYTSFVQTSMAEGGNLIFESLGDAKTIFVFRSSTTKVEMTSAAPGWGMGARNASAVYVYGTDGSTGMIMGDNTASALYGTDMGLNKVYLRVKTEDWTSGGIAIGLMNSGDRAKWYTLEGNSGIAITLAKHVLDGVVQEGKIVVSVSYNDVTNVEHKLVTEGIVIDWTDGVYYDISITGNVGANDWAINVGDLTINAAHDAAAENFNELMDTVYNGFTGGSAKGNGYLFTNDDSANTDFTIYFASLMKANKVTVNAKTTSLKVGETTQASVSISPSAALQSGTWSSSDTAVITVDENGLITAVGAGTANVIFTTEDGSTGTLEITVSGDGSSTDGGDDSGASGGCSGSVAWASGILGGLLLLGAVAVILKRKNA
ncbi:MAG: hypothetical protein DBX39_01400 [Bacillota bacterium]|nr:MAG: hypothetical protein DBX39_01400 [Bacillota bacterium]